MLYINFVVLWTRNSELRMSSLTFVGRWKSDRRLACENLCIFSRCCLFGAPCEAVGCGFFLLVLELAELDDDAAPEIRLKSKRLALDFGWFNGAGLGCWRLNRTECDVTVASWWTDSCRCCSDLLLPALFSSELSICWASKNTAAASLDVCASSFIISKVLPALFPSVSVLLPILDDFNNLLPFKNQYGIKHRVK